MAPPHFPNPIPQTGGTIYIHRGQCQTQSHRSGRLLSTFVTFCAKKYRPSAAPGLSLYGAIVTSPTANAQLVDISV